MRLCMIGCYALLHVAMSVTVVFFTFFFLSEPAASHIMTVMVLMTAMSCSNIRMVFELSISTWATLGLNLSFRISELANLFDPNLDPKLSSGA